MARSANAISAWLALVLAAGCTSLDGLSGDGGSRSRTTPAPSATTTQGGPACDATKPLKTSGPMSPVGTNVSGARWDATKTTIVFDVGIDLDAEFRIGASIDDATMAPFAPIMPPPDAGAIALIFPSLSNDGLVLYYQALVPDPNQPGAASSSIYVATRSNKTQPFQNPEPVAVAFTGADVTPYLASTAGALYWTHYDFGAASVTAHVMRWPVDKQGDPTSVLDDPSGEVGNAIVSADEKTMYYGARRAGSRDIFVATRASTSEPFSNGVRVAELSTSGNDEDPTWISDDQCEILYEVLDTNKNTSAIWSAQR